MQPFSPRLLVTQDWLHIGRTLPNISADSRASEFWADVISYQSGRPVSDASAAERKLARLYLSKARIDLKSLGVNPDNLDPKKLAQAFYCQMIREDNLSSVDFSDRILLLKRSDMTDFVFQTSWICKTPADKGELLRQTIACLNEADERDFLLKNKIVLQFAKAPSDNCDSLLSDVQDIIQSVSPETAGLLLMQQEERNDACSVLYRKGAQAEELMALFPSQDIAADWLKRHGMLLDFEKNADLSHMGRLSHASRLLRLVKPKRHAELLTRRTWDILFPACSEEAVYIEEAMSLLPTEEERLEFFRGHRLPADQYKSAAGLQRILSLIPSYQAQVLTEENGNQKGLLSTLLDKDSWEYERGTAEEILYGAKAAVLERWEDIYIGHKSGKIWMSLPEKYGCLCRI